MQAAGFVLAGGASSRMGRNKAFLQFGGRTLLEIAAAAVGQAAGNVTIIGDPETYSHLGFPVIPDVHPNSGPLGGIETALLHTASDWNLVVACDMPRLTRVPLRRILDEAEAHPEAGCILPRGPGGWAEPLCAAYHRRILPAVSQALRNGIRKVTSGLPPVETHYLSMAGEPAFQNVNTPEEWRRAQEQP